MRSGPSKIAEAVVARLVPPACREEVLGDLFERFRSPRQYFLDALRTVPLVILSRVRRTADPRLVLIQAFALYLSFVGAAWFADPALVHDQQGLLRLAIPAGAALIVLTFEDAYARPGPRSALGLARGPALGLGLAWMSQALFVMIPGWVMLYGCAMSLVISTAVRMLFPPGMRLRR